MRSAHPGRLRRLRLASAQRGRSLRRGSAPMIARPPRRHRVAVPACRAAPQRAWRRLPRAALRVRAPRYAAKDHLRARSARLEGSRLRQPVRKRRPDLSQPAGSGPLFPDQGRSARRRARRRVLPRRATRCRGLDYQVATRPWIRVRHRCPRPRPRLAHRPRPACPDRDDRRDDGGPAPQSLAESDPSGDS